MAEILKSFPFHGRSSSDLYPWDEWFDGKIRKLVRGKDFEISPQTFRASIYGAARRRGVAVKTSQVSENEVVIQAFKNGEK